MQDHRCPSRCCWHRGSTSLHDQAEEGAGSACPPSQELLLSTAPISPSISSHASLPLSLSLHPFLSPSFQPPLPPPLSIHLSIHPSKDSFVHLSISLSLLSSIPLSIPPSTLPCLHPSIPLPPSIPTAALGKVGGVGLFLGASPWQRLPPPSVVAFP